MNANSHSAAILARLGPRLREIREKRGMTMRAVAEAAGVTESLISQIERSRVSPAIDTLVDVADAIGVDLEYLFSEFRREHPVNIIRHGERPRLDLGTVVYERLAAAAEKSEHGIEAYLLEIAPGAEKGDTEYGHIGRELGVVIDGEGEFSIGTQVYQLKKGDSISFEADVPHVLRNTGRKKLQAFWVVTPPKKVFEKY